ncbi:unnamed protein product [marine sediment metagenome]|uniref:Type II secretion system protein GspG C-terminal domain-containing protein n=1 Tax=marine sediment metagenome TaxID=412755 RepID=X0TWJ0_9ZZZZ
MTHKGFSLVEILIVVVILAILAAIVVPQFTSAAEDAKESRVTKDLQSLRGQLALYRFDHKNSYPTDIKTQLTTQTDVDGNPGSDYGPYMREFPANPFIDHHVQTVKVDGHAGSGWKYTAASGELLANDGNDDFTKY